MRWLMPIMMLAACETTDVVDCDPLEDVQPMPIYIDSACADRDVQVIVEGVLRLNALSMELACRPMVEVIGYIVVNHLEYDLDGGSGACYYHKPDWYDDHFDNLKGSAREGENIRLFFFMENMSTSARLSLVMHELFHFVGVHGHTDDPRDIMYTAGEGKTKYTDGDGALFCASIDCL